MAGASSDKLKSLAERSVALPPQPKSSYLSRSSNDNGVSFSESNAADVRANAALALKESLIHNLVDNSIIDLAQATNVDLIANYTTQAVVNHMPRDRPLQHWIFSLSDVRHRSGYGE